MWAAPPPPSLPLSRCPREAACAVASLPPRPRSGPGAARLSLVLKSLGHSLCSVARRPHASAWVLRGDVKRGTCGEQDGSGRWCRGAGAVVDGSPPVVSKRDGPELPASHPRAPRDWVLQAGPAGVGSCWPLPLLLPEEGRPVAAVPSPRSPERRLGPPGREVEPLPG